MTANCGKGYPFPAFWYYRTQRWAVTLHTAFTVIGFLAIHFYNGEEGNSSRLVNYLFYPVTLLVIGLIAKFAF